MVFVYVLIELNFLKILFRFAYACRKHIINEIKSLYDKMRHDTDMDTDALVRDEVGFDIDLDYDL